MENWIGLHHAIIPDVFAERPFRLGVTLGIQKALDHIFGVRRHIDIVAHAFDDRHRRAAHGAHHFELIRRLRRADRCHEIRRMRADGKRNRQRLFARHGIEIDDAQIARCNQIDAGMARPAQHHPAAADVGVTGRWELREVETGGNIRRAVLAVLKVHRQSTKIGILACEHDFLHRRFLGRDFHRLLQVCQAFRQRRKQPGLVGVERDREPPPRTHHIANELGALWAGRTEMGRARIAVEHGRHIHKVDRLLADLALPHLHQAFDEAAQPEFLGIGHQPASIGNAPTLRRDNKHQFLSSNAGKVMEVASKSSPILRHRYVLDNFPSPGRYSSVADKLTSRPVLITVQIALHGMIVLRT